MEAESVEVVCYSGYRYAQRPTALVWEGSRIEVGEVVSEWREPGARYYRVRTDDDRRFELCYDERNLIWTAVELV
jgi:hypothetical protein